MFEDWAFNLLSGSDSGGGDGDGNGDGDGSRLLVIGIWRPSVGWFLFVCYSSPRPDGGKPQSQVALIEQVGAWISHNAEAICGTQAGPLSDASWGSSTVVGNNLYLHVTDLNREQLSLKTVQLGDWSQWCAATLVGEDSALPVQQTEQGWSLSLPSDREQP